MLRIAVLDDNQTDLRETAQALQQFFKQKSPLAKAEIFPFSSSDELLEQTASGAGFDLYYLAVVLSGMNGIEVAEKIREEDERALIVFLSVTPLYMAAAFNVQAFQYLLKPISKNKDFFPVLEKALAFLARSDPFLVIATKTGSRRIPFSKIAFAESLGHRVYLHLGSGDTVATAAGSETLSQIAEKLLVHPDFVLTHRAYLVNLRYVAGITRTEFLLSGGEHVPISRSRHREVKERYFQFLS